METMQSTGSSRRRRFPSLTAFQYHPMRASGTNTFMRIHIATRCRKPRFDCEIVSDATRGFPVSFPRKVRYRLNGSTDRAFSTRIDAFTTPSNESSFSEKVSSLAVKTEGCQPNDGRCRIMWIGQCREALPEGGQKYVTKSTCFKKEPYQTSWLIVQRKGPAAPLTRRSTLLAYLAQLSTGRFREMYALLVLDDSSATKQAKGSIIRRLPAAVSAS